MVLDLICSQKAHGNEDIGQVDEPEGLKKSKARQHVAMGIVPKCSITKAST